MIHYRKSKESDLEQIKNLIETCFGDRTAYFVYYNLDERYSLAFDDNKLIAMTGITDDCVYDGLEVDWTCVHPDYRHLGLVTDMLRELIPSNCDKDIYCSCWKTSDKINLYHAMKEFGFELSVENYRTYESNSEACKICVNNGKIENCHCSEDLYIKKNGKDNSRASFK